MKNHLLLTAVSLAILLVSPSQIYSQSKQDLSLNEAPDASIRRVYETITSKMELSDASKKWLITAYARQDRLIASLILENTYSATYIKRFTDSTGWAIENEFQKILTPEERSDFDSKINMTRTYAPPVFNNRIEPDAEMNSVFGIALKMKTRLALTKGQGDSILNFAVQLAKKIAFSKANPDSGYFDRTAFESNSLSMVLSEKQYSLLLADKNIKECDELARYAWHDMTVSGISNRYNKDSTIKKITVFYLLKAHISERFAHEKERKSQMLKSLKIPEQLKALQAAKTGSQGKLEQYGW